MDGPRLVVPATDRSPALRFRVSSTYCLYHYLVGQGQLPPDRRDPATAEAAVRAARVREPRGVHGPWTGWEVPLAAAATVDAATDGLRAAMSADADELGAAIRAAEPHFRAAIWAARRPAIDRAVAALRTGFAPHFPALARRQAEALGLTWPPEVDVFLVPESYDRFGAYGHPLTIDVSRIVGPELGETVLHELTHVADLHTHDAGGEGLGDRLTRRLLAAGLGRQRAWDAWHGVIFASAAHAVRELVDGRHTDYALPRGLYERFGVPELPRLWADLAAGRVGEPAFLEAIAAQVGAGPQE